MERSDLLPRAAKRPRRAAMASKAHYDDEDAGSDSPPEARYRGGGNTRRAGRANKKRDDRSALVEVWMVRNEQGDKPSPDIKDQYAESLKIPTDKFWDLMKMYAVRSKLSCVPDFEQIWHHVKDKADILSHLRVQGVDFWWELDASGTHYKPNTQNLKNFKPASGLLHHFYEVFINDEARYSEVRHNKAAQRNARIEPRELEELVKKLSPFRLQPDLKAVVVVSDRPELRGTYALTKKVNGFHVFVRPARTITKGHGPVRSLVVNGVALDVPEDAIDNYATEENGLAVFYKDDRAEDGPETFQDVPFRIRKGEDLLEAQIADMADGSFRINDLGLTIYPIRGLLPEHPEAAGIIDFGAVWSGCFAPFPRTSASIQEFSATFLNFPSECLEYFFKLGHCGDILAEEYIRFMTWFANFPDGLGRNVANVRALYQSLKIDDVPFYLQSQADELTGRQQLGLYVIRPSDTKPCCLTIEVAKDEGENPYSVLCFRVRVRFIGPGVQEGTRGGKTVPGKKLQSNTLPQVEFALEAAEDGGVTTRKSLGAPIMKRVEALAGLGQDVRLQPLHRCGTNLERTPRGSAPQHRKRLLHDDALPPPMAKMGPAGASAFNDDSFDISGRKQRLASRVRRQRSNVPTQGQQDRGQEESSDGSVDRVKEESPRNGIEESRNGLMPPPMSVPDARPPLNEMGQYLPMPSIGREQSLGLPGKGARESVGKGESWDRVVGDVGGLTPSDMARDHSLLPFLTGGGMGRDLSLGSLGDPSFGRSQTQESLSGELGGLQ